MRLGSKKVKILLGVLALLALLAALAPWVVMPGIQGLHRPGT